MLDVIRFTRLIKVSISALMVVAGGATAMAVVSNGHDAPTASISVNRLDKGDALQMQSTAERFRSEFAEWPVRHPRRQRMPFTD